MLRTAIKLLGPLVLMVTIAAAPPAMAQTCNSKPKDCRKLTGSKKDDCLIYNGEIQHACNIAKQDEDINKGGKGKNYDKDQSNTDNAGKKQ